MSIEALLTHGLLAGEEFLLQFLEENSSPTLDAVRRIRVVVPSNSLRDHLYRSIAVRRPAWIGLDVVTLHQIAREILDHLDRPHHAGGAVFELLVRRLALEFSSLRVSQTTDTNSIPTGSVAALLDAGFDASHQDALADLFAIGTSEDITTSQRRRARAVGRIAVTIRTLEETWGPITTSGLFRAAGEGIRLSPAVLPISRFVMYGFRQPTAVETDFLDALLSVGDGTSISDIDPPASATGLDVSARHQVESFSDADGHSEIPHGQTRVVATTLRKRPRVFTATGPDSETRIVAGEVHRLVHSLGIAAESIIVLLGSPEHYGASLRRHFRSLGLPFSSSTIAGSNGRLQRLVSFFIELLDRGAKTRCQRLIDSLELTDSRAGLQRSSAKLSTVAHLELAELTSSDDRELHNFSDLAHVARPLQAALSRWAESDRKPLTSHFADLREILSTLGDTVPSLELRKWFESFVAHAVLLLPEDLRIDATEVVQLIRDHEPVNPFGGRGGGVQVFPPQLAAGLTAEAVFVLGTVRGTFPRPLSSDPYLSDSVRLSVRALLPDLEIGPDFLESELSSFRRLLAASPRVTLSFPQHDFAGRPSVPSPFLASFAKGAIEYLEGPHDRDFQQPRTQAEHRVSTALVAGARQADLAKVVGGARLQMARASTLAALNEDRIAFSLSRRHDSLASFHGRLVPGDLAEASLTKLEAYASCPWRSFLISLGLNDSQTHNDSNVPDLGPRLVGIVVHRTLEAVAGKRTKRTASWPDAVLLAEALLTESIRTLFENQPGHLEFAPILAALAQPYMDRARDLVWHEGKIEVEQVEAARTYRVRDSQQNTVSIRFRVDLIEGNELRGRRSTDYKTQGGPKGRSNFRRELHSRVRRGEWLQAPVYALSSREPARFVFLDPQRRAANGIVDVDPASSQLRRDLDEVLRLLVDGWGAGVFFPRLLDTEGEREPRLCSVCEVSMACSRKESGVARRIKNLLLEPTGDKESLGQFSHALWQLPGAKH